MQPGYSDLPLHAAGLRGIGDRVRSLGELIEAALAAPVPEPLLTVTRDTPRRARALSGRPSGAVALPGQLAFEGFL